MSFRRGADVGAVEKIVEDEHATSRCRLPQLRVARSSAYRPLPSSRSSNLTGRCAASELPLLSYSCRAWTFFSQDHATALTNTLPKNCSRNCVGRVSCFKNPICR